MNAYETQYVKIPHIGTINLLNARIGRRDSFEELNRLSVEELERLRDELIVIYNAVIVREAMEEGI